MQLLRGVFSAIILLAMLVVPIVCAENITPATTPFISIDPIANHSVNDVFYVNGTTNLPVGVILYVGTNPVQHRSKGFYSDFATNISVKQGDSGVNIWSCNISPVLWWTGNYDHDIRRFQTGQHYIVVFPEDISYWRLVYANISNPLNAMTFSNYFTISSGDLAPTSNISQNCSPTHSAPATLGQVSGDIDRPAPATSAAVPLSWSVPLAAVIMIAVIRSLDKKGRI